MSSKDCGLGDDFFRVLQEAASKFPGIDLSGGSDQLVLFVSPACSSGMVGEGTIGDSFATGGALIVKAGKTIDGTYATRPVTTTGSSTPMSAGPARPWSTTAPTT